MTEHDMDICEDRLNDAKALWGKAWPGRGIPGAFCVVMHHQSTRTSLLGQLNYLHGLIWGAIYALDDRERSNRERIDHLEGAANLVFGLVELVEERVIGHE